MKNKLILFVSCLAFGSALHGQVGATINFSISQTPCDLSINSDQQPATEISVYPNPTEGNISINVIGMSEFVSPTLIVYNLIGETILTVDEKKISTNYTKQIDLTLLPAGIYFVRVSNGNSMYAQVFKVVLIN